MNSNLYLADSKFQEEGFIRDEQLYEQISRQKQDNNLCKRKNTNQHNKKRMSLKERQNSNQQYITSKKNIQPYHTLDNNRHMPQKKSPKKQIKKIDKGLPAIKIIRFDQSMHNCGILVYKGLRPKTSDKYFKYFQQNNMEIPLIKQKLTKNLTFSSKFECGNIDYVFKTNQTNYNLYMRVDTNTLGHQQWYYFSVKNKKCCNVNFIIHQFSKSLSLYQRGMKPYIFSKKLFQQKHIEWTQVGYNIKYKPKEIQAKKKYILSFQYDFIYENDQVFFAACPPYSYTLLNQRIQKYKKLCCYKYQIQQLTQSLCGLSVPIITISNTITNNQKQKYIVIAGRSHPGETSSSWVIDGILESFTRQNNQNSRLLQKYILKIVPMMNPDGVFMGNYRTGILGLDYNRSFNSGKQNLFPQCSSLKKLIRQLKKISEIGLFLDVHGHSIQRNSFIFGPEKQQLINSDLTKFCQQIACRSRYFKIQSCKFSNQISKIQTARVYFQYKQKILSLTLQNSLGLYHFNQIIFPFFTIDWMKLGNHIIDGLSQSTKFININKKSNDKTQNHDTIQTVQKKQMKTILSKTTKRFIAQKLECFQKKFKFDKQFKKIMQKQKQKSAEKQIAISYQKNGYCNTFYSTALQKRMQNINSVRTNRTKINNKFHSLKKTQFSQQKKLPQLWIKQDNLSETYNDNSLNDSDDECQNLPQQLLEQVICCLPKKQNQSQLKRNIKKLDQITEKNQQIKMPVFNLKIKKKQLKLVKDNNQIPFIINKLNLQTQIPIQSRQKYRKRLGISRLNHEPSVKTQPTNFNQYLNGQIYKYKLIQPQTKILQDLYTEKKIIQNLKMCQLSPVLKALKKKKQYI